MENKSHALAAGVFVITVAIMLLGLAFWLTRDQGSYQTYEMTTSQAVTGLQPQAAVRYKGVAVGKVVHIGFDPEQPGNVLIRITVDETTPITGRTFATLGYQGVTGLAYIDLDNSSFDLPELGVTNKGYKRIGMRPSSLSQLAAMGPEVIGDVRTTMASINALLSEGNRDELMGTIRNFGQAAQSSASLMQNIDQTWTKSLEPALLKLTKDVGNSMVTLQHAARNIESLSQEVATIANKLNRDDGSIVKLNQGIEAFTRVAEEINNGTLPKLDRTMADVSSSMLSIRELARGLSRNPQSLLYGSQSDVPGPGEPGYKAP